MDSVELKFPTYFPENCPPVEETDEECVLFRLCKGPFNWERFYFLLSDFSTKELSINLNFIDLEIEEMVDQITVYGQLARVYVKLYSFEFIAAENENIKGQIALALSSIIFSVPSIKEDFEIRISADSMTREEKLLYTLTAINPIVDLEALED